MSNVFDAELTTYGYQKDNEAISLERVGDMQKAIEIYEHLIEVGYDGPHPYQRLAIIYRKQKQFKDEIRVLERAVFVYENIVCHKRVDRIPKLNKFKERLVKVRALANKN
ncbi:hypothetical protein AM501_26890 [Aneurinibacillus migulanus]|uniref:Uncharacterized protein n=1 Tax=Aneurinibacillus migulanus TaxID=47500 RepID=A0A0M0GZJ7_ANEMI|nr:tetratricopeptide repeat protein [Aneurinibacillus migulanus]KON95243.1 hypothetical protein AF333_06865 [Aneurinibacillus migulanus]KPD05343.1 hypothetical protein AM501_26890 [Aneurinibacillus migulanus]MED0895740.1 tetratricopeptide repeat protein [Aneurinibacillus migulanus]MED1619262.1 tetratricopeptide repeat protein [Aneurinibacillus migulanus]SDK33229.1 hypothetical protein SAMN04487909_14934 [Aneurinibacillus migulanus]